MHTFWGQFIDHDISLTPSQSGSDAESIAISVPAGDPFFDPGSSGTAVIPLNRSTFNPLTGSTNPREHQNTITTWIDASSVYGSDKETADSLRTFSEGKMKTSEGDLHSG